MSPYYTALALLCVISMLSVQLSVAKSTTLSRSRKRLFYMLFSSIAVSCLCEWVGVYLQGAGPSTRVLHIAVKVIELSLAPTIAVWIAWIIERRWGRAIHLVIALNTLLQLASGFFGFIYSVDENSVYTHQRFYWLYVAAFLISIAYYVYVMVRNLKKFQYNGGLYALSTVAVLLVGIYMQMSADLRVIYITAALTAVMSYVFALEMIQQTDELTELINRRGFENCLAHMDDPCVILFMDVDHFKSINDIYGHAYGDAVLRTVGRAILRQYSRFGRCFRYGGDEFCVVLTRNTEAVESLNGRFLADLETQRGKEPHLPTVSVGYVRFDPLNDTVEDAMAEADQMMYRCKEKHHADAE